MHERHTNERLHSPLPTTNVFCVPKKATTNSIGNLIKLIADWLCDRPNIWFLFLSGFFFLYCAVLFLLAYVFLGFCCVFAIRWFDFLLANWGVSIYRGVINPRTLTDLPSHFDQGHRQSGWGLSSPQCIWGIRSAQTYKPNWTGKPVCGLPIRKGKGHPTIPKG